MPKDRRQHPRVPIDVTVDFKSRGNFYAARAGDISSGGLFLGTRGDSLPIGTEVEIRLRLLNKAYALHAEVVWELTDETGAVTGVGVRFIALPPAAERTIKTFMALRAPMLFGHDEEAE
jgi:uncharacterized protein (TIGR02266 family)